MAWAVMPMARAPRSWPAAHCWRASARSRIPLIDPLASCICRWAPRIPRWWPSACTCRWSSGRAPPAPCASCRTAPPGGRMSATAASIICAPARSSARTRDHSHVELLLQEGLISSQQAQNHPMRNFVETCLGGDPLLPEMLHRPQREASRRATRCWSAPMASGRTCSTKTSPPRCIPACRCKTALQAITEFAVRRAGAGADNASVAVLKLL